MRKKRGGKEIERRERDKLGLGVLNFFEMKVEVEMGFARRRGSMGEKFSEGECWR